MTNKRGFTMVELLAAIVILGIVTALSFPALQVFTNQNNQRKYDIYNKSLINAAKLYMDSYEDDFFTPGESGCAYISYERLYRKKLIKDIEIENHTCYSDNTFVKVDKTNGKYKYEGYLGCGTGDGSAKITSVSIIYPQEDTPHTMSNTSCKR